MGRQRWQPLNDRHQLAEPLGCEKPVKPSLIVLLLQGSRCEGRIESGVEPIAFSVSHRSVRRAPIGRRDRQVAAHPSRLLGACADIALPERPDCAHGDGDQREFPDRALYLLDLAIKVVALGLIPEGRRPSSATAWLLLILFLPVIGILAFWLIGSPFVDQGRRRRQAAAGEVISGALIAETDDLLPVPAGSTQVRSSSSTGG